MTISPTGNLVNIVAGLPTQGSSALVSPASPGMKAAQAALAARQAQQQVAVQQHAVPSLTAETHRAVANMPRGSLLNILV